MQVMLFYYKMFTESVAYLKMLRSLRVMVIYKNNCLTGVTRDVVFNQQGKGINGCSTRYLRILE